MCDTDSNIIIIDRFYIALFSALEQTHLNIQPLLHRVMARGSESSFLFFFFFFFFFFSFFKFFLFWGEGGCLHWFL